MNALLILPLALAISGRAEPVEAPKGAAVSASTSSARVEVSTRPPTAAEIVDKIRELDSTLKSLKAGFHQVLETEAGLKQMQAGKLYYEKPDHIRLEFESPRRQVTVSDKKVLWVYQPDDKQVIKADWEDWRKGQAELAGLLDFGQYGSLLDKHESTVDAWIPEGSSAPVAGAWKLTLKPKSSALYTIRLIVAAPDYFPKRTELEMERMKISSELSDISINAKLDAKLFEFKPPAGLPVIQLSTP